MQWRRKTKVCNVIGSATHALLFLRYEDLRNKRPTEEAGSDDEAESPKTNGFGAGRGGEGGTRYHPGSTGYHHHNPRYNGKGGNGNSGRTFSSQSTPTRRNGYQHQHYQNGGRSHSSTSDTPKITFNEDEYTRITTPRQDVLFKKGYLSRRKPLVATPSTSSAEPGASTSAPSTPSTQSTSPEHHAHVNELPADSEMVLPEGMMFPNGFYDQNGVFYVNAALANFDGFGPMMMMPYGPYPPYGHIEYYNQVCLQHPYTNNANCADSQASEASEATSPQEEPTQSSPEDSGKASMNDKDEAADSTGEAPPQSGESASSTGAPAEVPEMIGLHNGVPPPPHYIYPGFMFGNQMYHMNGMNIQCANGLALGGPLDVSNKQKYKKKRRRKQRKPSGCNGTTATDYSEDEYSTDSEPVSTSSQRASSGSSMMSNMNGTQEQWIQDQLPIENGDDAPIIPKPPVICDPLKSVLNTNCSEFIPKAQLLAKTSQLKTDVCEFVPQSLKDKQNTEKQTEVVENKVEKPVENGEPIETSKPIANASPKKKVAPLAPLAQVVPVAQVAPTTPVKDKVVEEKPQCAPVTMDKKTNNVVTNGFAHKTNETQVKKQSEVVEPVRKVQIVCVEKSPPVCSTPRGDQWTTVKSSRSKNKKGRQETASASPTSPISDVASENTFQMFVDGSITPPPSEEDGSLESEKIEETIYFTSDDATDNVETKTETETNLSSPKKNVKPTKAKAKKNKKVKEQGKAKPSQLIDSNIDERKNKNKISVNGKAYKPAKQVNMASVKTKLAQLSGPMTSTIIEFNHIESRDQMNGIGIEELKELYIELPELKDPQLEDMLEAAYRKEEISVFTPPILTVTANAPIEESQKDILPPTPDESLDKSAIVLTTEQDKENSELKVDIEEPVVERSTSEEYQIAPEEKIQNDLQLASDTTDTGATVKIPSYDDLDSPDISTFHSVPDITEDTTVDAKELLMDEGVILAETTTPSKESEESPLHLTEAVRRWLSEQKEKSPEPVLREPDDPALAALLGTQPRNDASGSSDQDTDDGEDGVDIDPKNLKGNPLRASSVKRNDERVKAKRSRSTPPTVRRGRGQGETGDTDSDYLSDIQDDTRKRVAGITSEPDLLDCWEPDILPFTALPHLCPEQQTEQAEDVLETYESVYGKSVDYEKLSASLGARKPVLPPLRGEGVAPPCSGICCSLM